MSIFDEIHELEPESPTISSVEAFLQPWRGRLTEVAAKLGSELKQRADDVGLNARETATHFVWPLSSNWSGRLGIYIHEYKAPEAMQPGYANTVHDHRYDFVSLMLSGGYLEHRYDMSRFTSGSSAKDLLTESRTASAGDVVTVANDVFHALGGVEPGTLTMVIKFPPVKDTSTSYDLENGTRIVHTPTESRVTQLVSLLESVRT